MGLPPAKAKSPSKGKATASKSPVKARGKAIPQRLRTDKDMSTVSCLSCSKRLTFKGSGPCVFKPGCTVYTLCTKKHAPCFKVSGLDQTRMLS